MGNWNDLPESLRARRIPCVAGKAELKVSLLPRGSRRNSCGSFEKLLFAVHQGIDVVRGEFESVAVRDRIRRAGFHAVAAENAPRIVDVVHRGVALARGNSVC